MTPGARRDPVPHGLGETELAALAAGRPAGAAIGLLIDAESSKHRLLVEAVRRRVTARSGDDGIWIDAACQLLSDVEGHSPQVVAGLLALPQIGGWAVDCLRRMVADEEGVTADRISLSRDLGYLAAVAAAAGLRAGHPFDLPVPLRDGMLLLPGLGIADLNLPGDSRGAAQVRLDADGAVVLANGRAVALPTGADLESGSPGAHWRPIPRLRTAAGGVVLDVLLDPFDPFLASVGEPAASLSDAEHAAWQLNVGEAWRVLVRHHRATAKAVAAAVSTVVPQAAAADANPRSATSGWTFGAIGLSLPRDAVSLAEMFVHEYQHLVLGAVEDLKPLVAAGHDRQLSYAPWRDDPRPVSGLLHGCYAYLGVTGFWRRQRRTGDPAERFRSSAEFARWRPATLDAATRLARSPALTEAGRGFAAGIRDQLARWQAEPVPAEAGELAGDVCTEHRVRWRLNNLRPAAAQIGALADAWLSGTSAVPDRVGTTIERARLALGPARAHLLAARYRDPARIRRLAEDGQGGADAMMRPVDEADLALLNGDRLAAIRGYRCRLRAADDMDAWAGLAVAMRLAGSPACARLLAARPEVVAAVHARVRELRGEAPDADRLMDWLAAYFATERHRGSDEWWR